MGRTQSPAPLLRLRRTSGETVLDGAQQGAVWGTYVHGLFDNAALRHAWLKSLGWRPQGVGLSENWREREYDRLADHVAAHVDINAIAALVEQVGKPSA